MRGAATPRWTGLAPDPEDSVLKTMLRLQVLDLKIETCLARESEIPKQKSKFKIQRERLNAELGEREKGLKSLLIEQKDCETEIGIRQDQIRKYQGQLNAVKKNDEYQALLHEIELTKKQIGVKEERVIAIMMELDDARARFEEDKKRIKADLADIDRQCAEIDLELEAAVADRKVLEGQQAPLVADADPTLVRLYKRIRASKKSGAAIVPLKDEVCGGCHMRLLPQSVNEILAGSKVHTCQHCGRLVYNRELYEQAEEAHVQ